MQWQRQSQQISRNYCRHSVGRGNFIGRGNLFIRLGFEPRTVWPESLESNIKGNDLPRVQVDAAAPDFRLNDLADHPVQLADFRGEKNVVLVFNRGFL